ncbi:MAG: FKBP-type peptidyl-prolyl cis-trans isomerase 2, partial [Oleiphilaceae bacterium]
MSDKLVYVLNYWLKNAEDAVVDTSEGGVPMMFMQGCKNTIQGIQDVVKGRI